MVFVFHSFFFVILPENKRNMLMISSGTFELHSFLGNTYKYCALLLLLPPQQKEQNKGNIQEFSHSTANYSTM